jgi:hypothetical protein
MLDIFCPSTLMTAETYDAAGAASAFAHPAHVCDLVMKGGITSGVVYPKAITELAKTFRFSSIGGTSAGAIAAAVAAAAEFARDCGGFERLDQIPAKLPSQLFGMFQPVPSLRPVFELGLALTNKTTLARKVLAGLKTTVRGFPVPAFFGALPGLGLVPISRASFLALCWRYSDRSSALPPLSRTRSPGKSRQTVSVCARACSNPAMPRRH